jgi:hypothetical protein
LECGIRNIANDGTRIRTPETLNTNENHLERKIRIPRLKVDIIVVLIFKNSVSITRSTVVGEALLYGKSYSILWAFKNGLIKV